jgi:hypothetical protein
VPGMPATTENVASVVARGVRYIYNHAPTLLGVGAAAYLKAGQAAAKESVQPFSRALPRPAIHGNEW